MTEPRRMDEESTTPENAEQAEPRRALGDESSLEVEAQRPGDSASPEHTLTGESVTDTDGDSDDEEEEVIYVKKRNPIMFFIGMFSLAIAGFFFVLLAAGFIMGMLDIRPPSVDWGIVNSQLDKVTGNESTDPPDELRRKSHSPTPYPTTSAPSPESTVTPTATPTQEIVTIEADEFGEVKPEEGETDEASQTGDDS